MAAARRPSRADLEGAFIALVELVIAMGFLLALLIFPD